MGFRRAMAHLAVNPRLAELHVIYVKAAPASIPELACMADSANGLVAGRSIQFLPGAEVGAFTATCIDDFPIVDPMLLQGAVLDGKNVNLSIGKPGRVSLLEFRTDSVVDGICMRFAVLSVNLEVVSSIADQHS